MTFEVIAGGDGVPPEPDWRLLFSDADDITVAGGEWGRVVRELQDCQALTVANGHMIERLTHWRVQYERAARQIAEKGPIIKAKRTNVPQISPWWTVMRQAGEEIRLLEVELGIPPVRRGKVTKVQRAKKAARGSDAYRSKSVS